MNWFLERIKDGDENITKFEFIYERINGDNFIEFVKLINQAWKKSRFIYPDTEKNPEFATTDGLLFLPYSSEKTLGFYFSNVSMSFETHHQKGRLIKTLYETGKTQKVDKVEPKTGTIYQVDEEIVDQFWYHPFYPIYLKDVEKQETDMKLDSIVPAFMLKANRDKQFWSNVITTAEYAADILTTISGVGNIAKFRYLAKFATKASKLRFVSKAGRAVVAARKAVAATAAVVEITSGTVNALLKLTGTRDTEWGKALSEYLFWLELLSLSGELTVAIHNGLRKSAKEILEHEDDLRKTAKNADELDEIEKVVEELKRVIGEQGTGGDITKSFFQNAKIALKEEIPLGSIVGQTKDYTCASNALKMILDDLGIVRSEDYLADIIDTVHKGGNRGANILDIPKGLMKESRFDAIETIARGGKKDVISVNALEKLLKKPGRKAIVSIATDDFGAHAVVVDKIENGRVFLRDPLPMYQGSSYSVTLEDFKKVYNKRFVTLK